MAFFIFYWGGWSLYPRFGIQYSDLHSISIVSVSSTDTLGFFDINTNTLTKNLRPKPIPIPWTRHVRCQYPTNLICFLQGIYDTNTQKIWYVSTIPILHIQTCIVSVSYRYRRPLVWTRTLHVVEATYKDCCVVAQFTDSAGHHF